MWIHADPHPDPDTQPCIFPVTTHTVCTGNIVVMREKWCAYLEHTSSLKLGRRLIVLLLPSLGRIKAMQLDYTEAHKHLLQSSRKAPQNSAQGEKSSATRYQ